MNEFINDQNQKIKESNLWRSLQSFSEVSAARIKSETEEWINFSSNDYLGMSTHPQVVQASIDALNRYGTGGRSSRLISGHLDLHKELESRLAQFKASESCLLFPTGFMANLGAISALCQEGDAIILDRLCHASIFDAVKLAKCRVFIYQHNDMQSLEQVLIRTQKYPKRLIATDGVFSMDGDLAALRQIKDLAKRYNAWLMVDDAHATGILGDNGIGVLEHFGMLNEVDIVVGTLSKALGSQGGFVTGSRDLIEYLINRARSFIFTTALSPVSTAAALKALEVIQKDTARRGRVLSHSQILQKNLEEAFPSYVAARQVSTQILPFRVGAVEHTLDLARHLKERGIYVPAIRPPTVPKNECRLRFSITSEHSQEDLQCLLKALNEYSFAQDS